MPHVKLSKEFASGVTDTSIAAGPNGYVLTVDTAAVSGFSWTAPGGGGGGSGTVTSVSGGANVTITGTATVAPIVSLSSPLTSTLNVGAQTISSTVGAININPLAGTDCNINCAGPGHAHIDSAGSAGPNQPLLVLENTNGNANSCHLDIFKNSPSPAANDGIGTLSFHANNSSGTSIEYGSISCDQRVATAGAEKGSVSIYAGVAGGTQFEQLRADGVSGQLQMRCQLDTRSNAITTTQPGALRLLQQNGGQEIQIENQALNGVVRLISSGTNGAIVLSSNVNQTFTSSNGSLILQAALAGSTRIDALGSTIPKLTTDIANVNYYPDFVVDNGNSTTASVPPPSVQSQRLTLINKGVSPAASWIDYGTAVFAGYNCICRTSNGYVWLADANSGSIQIWNDTITSYSATITLTGNSERAYVMFEDSGYVYIGGSFTAVNGNATAQYNITRVSIYSFTEDPMWDSFNLNYGVNGEVYCINTYLGNLVFGGSFTTLAFSGQPANYIAQISNYNGSSGNQTYNQFSDGVNDYVFALYVANNYLFVGGQFTYVQWSTSPLNYPYLATNYYGVWDYCGANAFNGTVRVIQNSPAYPYLFVGGDFNLGSTYNCYIDFTAPNNAAVSTTLNLTAPMQRNTAYYYGSLILVDSNTMEVWFSNGFSSWASQGISLGFYSFPTFIGYFSSEIKVGFQSYNYVRTKTTVAQTCAFTLTSGNFRWNGGSYTTYTLGLPNLAVQFVADSLSSWTLIGYSPWGSYS